MAAKYFPGLFRKYQPLRGQDWIKALPDEERQAFARIGMMAHGYGKQGGLALVQKKGREWMKEIGRRGAIKSNQVKALKRAQDERYAPVEDEVSF